MLLFRDSQFSRQFVQILNLQRSSEIPESLPQSVESVTSLAKPPGGPIELKFKQPPRDREPVVRILLTFLRKWSTGAANEFKCFGKGE